MASPEKFNPKSIVVGAGPCNFGIIENYWKDSTSGCLSYKSYLNTIKKAGYHATEMGDNEFLPLDVHDDPAMQGLKMMGAFVEISLTKFVLPEEEMEELDTVAKSLTPFVPKQGRGPFAPHIVLADRCEDFVRMSNSGRITADLEPNEEQKKNLKKNISFILQHVYDKHDGLPVYFHPHCSTWIETPKEIDWLLDEVPQLKIIFDTGHLHYASGGKADLIQLADQYKERIGSFHFKDLDEEVMRTALAPGVAWTYMEAVRNGLVVNLGDGCIDSFPKIVQWQKDNGYEGFTCAEQESFSSFSAANDAVTNKRYLDNLYQGPIRVALIGCGRIGTIHALNLSKDPNFDLRYVVDIKREVAQGLVALVGVGQAREMKDLPDLDVDAVVICTPTPTHKDIILLCCERGLHIFCEKPICITAQSIKECFDTAQEKGVKLYCGFQRRFDYMWREFQWKLKDRDVAHLRLFGGDSPLPSIQFLRTSGGIYHDLMIHDIDQARWIMEDEVVSVYATSHTWTPEIREEGIQEETGTVVLTFKRGGICVIQASRCSSVYDARMEALCTTGEIIEAGFHPHDESTHKFKTNAFTRYAKAYKEELGHFADCIRSEVPPEITKQDCLINTTLADLCVKSDATGTVQETAGCEFMRNQRARRKSSVVPRRRSSARRLSSSELMILRNMSRITESQAEK